MSVYDFPVKRRQAAPSADKSTSGGVDNGGGPPHDGDMESRIQKLESVAEKTAERLSVLERDVAVIKSNYSTKADVSDAKSSIIMWVVSAIFLAQLLPVLLKKFGV